MGDFIGFFSSTFGYLLNFIYGIINNYGMALILFSIILKIVLIPLSYKQQKSTRKSAEIQKEVKIIKDKYGKDLEKVNQETMALYKRENTSPFSGCLSGILQIVIVFAMFYLVRSPLTFMKHVSVDDINNYKSQISEYDESINTTAYPEIVIIKEMGINKETEEKNENIFLNMEFFGLDLSMVPKDNYKMPQAYILPALYVLSSIFSTKITMSAMEVKKKKKDDELIEIKTDKKPEEEEDMMSAMTDVNKNMKYFMPIMYVSMSVVAPLGLALYWLVNNLLTIGEKLILNRIIDKEESAEDGK